MVRDVDKSIIDYTKRNGTLSNYFIRNIIEGIVETEKLKKFIIRVEQDYTPNNGEDLSVSYNAMQKRFKFQLNTTYNYQFDQYYNCFNNYERPFYINARILIKIFKEIEYANIHRVVLSKDKSFETMLLKTCFSDYLTIQKLEEMIHNKEIANPELVQKIITNYYKFIHQNPLERYARINAIKRVLQILKRIEAAVPNLYQFEEASLVEEMLSGYIYRSPKVIAPTPEYLSEFHHQDFWTKQDFYNENPFYLEDKITDHFGLTKKFELGLPVRNYEYREKADELSQSLKYKRNF